MKISLILIISSIIYAETLGEKLIEEAKNYIDVPFVFGGRSKRGIDCMGVIFLPYSKVTGKSWKRLSTNPRELVEKEMLGKPVSGLNGVLKNNIDYSKFKKGDIVYFLVSYQIGNVKHFMEIDNIKYWVWHMGIFTGFDENEVPLILHACPSHKVIIQPIKEIYFEAIFVTRLDEQD